MGVMSASNVTDSASRRAGWRSKTPSIEPLAPGAESLTRMLWMQDRGLAELRWAAVTLATMAILGFVAGLLHTGGDFERVRLVATPAALLVAVAAWGQFGSRLGRSRLVRHLLGPIVLMVAAAGSGMADVATLQLPSAAPLILLAMAFSALTPGFRIAVVLLLGSSGGIFLAHALGSLAPDAPAQVTDRFFVNVVVTLLASTGIAIVVRIATDAENRANRLAARSDERIDVLERLNRIVGRFDGSQSVDSVIQGVVDDVAADFDIAMVSMYLPDADGRLAMVGVAGYDEPIQTWRSASV